jgi:hypothetical protein
MIDFDTKVLSEALKSEPSADVLHWVTATNAAATKPVSVWRPADVVQHIGGPLARGFAGGHRTDFDVVLGSGLTRRPLGGRQPLAPIFA